MTTDNKPATDSSHFKTSVPLEFKLDTKNMVHTIGFAPTCTGMSAASDPAMKRRVSQPLRWLSRAILGGVAALLFVGVLATIERVYLVNGKAYPRWLADGEVGWVDDAILTKLRATECNNEPIEIFKKDGGLVVLRCGFAWFASPTKTFIADSSDN